MHVYFFKLVYVMTLSDYIFLRTRIFDKKKPTIVGFLFDILL